MNYRIIKAVADTLGSAIVTIDIAFHRAIEVLDGATARTYDAAGRAAVRKADNTVRKEVMRFKLLERAAHDLVARADEASLDVEYTIDEQHDALITALQALPGLPEDLRDRLDQAINDNNENRVARASA